MAVGAMRGNGGQWRVVPIHGSGHNYDYKKVKWVDLDNLWQLIILQPN